MKLKLLSIEFGKLRLRIRTLTSKQFQKLLTNSQAEIDFPIHWESIHLSSYPAKICIKRESGMFHLTKKFLKIIK